MDISRTGDQASAQPGRGESGPGGSPVGLAATVEGPPAVAPAPAAARPARGGRSARDMTLSIAVLLIPIFIFLGVYRIFFSGDAPIAADATQTYANAHHDAPFPVLEPTGLPHDWTAINASFGQTSGSWVLRVSYVPPAHTGLQLVESDRPVNDLLADELGGDARPGTLEVIDGRTWREYPQVRGGSRALVLAEQGHTTIVSGTASDADLHDFVAALH